MKYVQGVLLLIAVVLVSHGIQRSKPVTLSHRVFDELVDFEGDCA
jgi:hypothetical protein